MWRKVPAEDPSASDPTAVKIAIIHGLEGSEDVGHIDICVKRSGQNVLSPVTDDGAGICGKRLRRSARELCRQPHKGRTYRHLQCQSESAAALRGGVRRDRWKASAANIPGGITR